MGGEVGSPRAVKASSEPTVYFQSWIRIGYGLRERRIARTRSLPALNCERSREIDSLS